MPPVNMSRMNNTTFGLPAKLPNCVASIPGRVTCAKTILIANQCNQDSIFSSSIFQTLLDSINFFILIEKLHYYSFSTSLAAFAVAVNL
jgi:hypothetical protein